MASDWLAVLLAVNQKLHLKTATLVSYPCFYPRIALVALTPGWQLEGPQWRRTRRWESSLFQLWTSSLGRRLSKWQHPVPPVSTKLPSRRLWFRSMFILRNISVARFNRRHQWSVSTKYIPYLALTAELWDVFCENLGENWPRYNGTALLGERQEAQILKFNAPPPPPYTLSLSWPSYSKFSQLSYEPVCSRELWCRKCAMWLWN